MKKKEEQIQYIIWNNTAEKFNLNYKNQMRLQDKSWLKKKTDRSINSEIGINPINLNQNDLVYLRIENRKKLDQFYDGPYKVEEISGTNCKIKNVYTNKTMVVHKTRLDTNQTIGISKFNLFFILYWHAIK